MFDPLNELIKSDHESQEKFDQFKVNFWKKKEKKRNDEKRQGRIISIVLASSAVVSILFGIYAFRAQVETEHFKAEINRLEIELKNCSN